MGYRRPMRALRGLAALAMVCALAACGGAPKPVPVAVAAPQPQTALASRLDAKGELALAGEPLNADLLRGFYARHGFQPVWSAHPAKADALVEAVLRAGDQGLDPELFHAGLLRRRASFPPLERDLLLSDSFLAYADALARGAVPVERRKDDQVLAPDPVDVPAVLDAALASPDPASVIEALAPSSPTYLALRQALRKDRPAAGGGDKAANARLRRVVVSLERERWLPRTLPTERVWVNVADEQLVLYRASKPVFTTRVVVGQEAERNQSPEFRADISGSLYNPPWVIPADIVKLEILPKIQRDPTYLTRNNMVMLAGGEIEQRAGPTAGLGLIMFDMPNKFDVYLHDTPDRTVFKRDNRRISHGCIRVQNPFEFAALLMETSIDSINQGVKAGTTTLSKLPNAVPVFVVYQTAYLDPAGKLQFMPDFYSRDAEIWRKLQKRPPEST